MELYGSCLLIIVPRFNMFGHTQIHKSQCCSIVLSHYKTERILAGLSTVDLDYQLNVFTDNKQ